MPDEHFSFNRAFETVFRPAEHGDVASFLRREQDDTYGDGVGQDARESLFFQLENYYEQARPLLVTLAEEQAQAEARPSPLSRTPPTRPKPEPPATKTSLARNRPGALGALELAAKLGADVSSASAFRAVLYARDRAQARSMLNDAAAQVSAAAEGASSTATGRNIRTQQAIQVLQAPGKSAAGETGVDAENRAIWCDSLAERLEET